MARPRDDDVRRAAILATIEAISASGMSGLSFREVARLTNTSTGTLSYHFGSKRGLLLEATRYGYWKLPESFEQQPAIDAMRYVLRRYVLSTPKRQAWWQFWLAICSHAQSDSELQELLATEYQSVVSRWTHAIDRGKEEGTFCAGIDGPSVARRLAAVAHGIAVAQLIGATTVETAAGQLRAELDALCTPDGLRRSD